jgi:TubC N-terminal docking domain
MTPAELVGSLRRRGILLVPAPDGRLRYRPREALSEAERAVLARHRDEILALLDADPIGWRTAVMAPQMSRSGTIPLLLARPGITLPLGSCCSCGDPLGPGDRYRCGPCVEAAVAVLEAVR